MKHPRSVIFRIAEKIGKHSGEGIANFFKPINRKLLRTFSELTFPFQSDVFTARVNGTSTSYFVKDPQELTTLRWNFIYEKKVRDGVLTSLREEDVFYDVGANLGTYSLPVAQKLGERAIYAFEPFRKNMDRLKENAELNGLEINLFPLALSDTNGTAEMEVFSDRPGETKNRLSRGRTGRKTVKVETRRCDDLIEERGLDKPDVVKIDVEGAELEVLRGMEESLENCRLIYCEVHKEGLEERKSSREELLKLLHDYGFDLGVIHRRGGDLEIKGEK
ncbi:MAG: FkbM family methyltransferase [Candidatus Aenigmatarchaeota archaeon]